MLRLVVILGVAAAVVSPVGATSAPELPLEQCTLSGGIDALCARLDVPENRSRPDGRRISLRVAVVPARERPRAPDPLVYLAGGPGGSAVEAGPGMLSAFRGINARRDIVLVDQRGTGGSNAIACPGSGEPTRTAAAVRAYVRRCLARLDADPTQYMTVPAMDDLAEQMDRILARLERAGMKNCPPRLNEKKEPSAWLSAKAAPWSKLANEKPKGETIAYEKLLQAWKEGRAR